MLELLIEIINKIMSMWNFNETKPNLIQNFSCINLFNNDPLDSYKHEYDLILDEYCIKKIYFSVRLGTKFQVDFDFDPKETKTINEIWKKLDDLGIDITKEQIKDIIKIIEEVTNENNSKIKR